MGLIIAGQKERGKTKNCGRVGEGLYLVKMSFVTAAMLYSSRRARQSLSIKAVLPDPTGLHKNSQ